MVDEGDRSRVIADEIVEAFADPAGVVAVVIKNLIGSRLEAEADHLKTRFAIDWRLIISVTLIIGSFGKSFLLIR